MGLKDKNLYYVGGVVRDKILNTPSFDIDYCYEGNAIEFSRNLNVIKTNPDFGTVRVLTNGGEVDIASTRTETYPKSGHLPVVENIGCSLKDDLKRRDFTINALAQNTLTGEIVDYFNGLEDIKNKKLQVLHANSFIDDPTRIIRGLKFSIRFDFELSEDTRRLQDEYLNNINYDMCFHRIKKEIKETFNLNRQDALRRFIDQGIYRLLGNNQTVPSVQIDIEALVNEFKPQNVWLVYAGLFDLSNLELTGEEVKILSSYEKIRNYKPVNDCEIYNLFKTLPLESVILYAILVDYDIASRFLHQLSNIKLEVKGDDLKELGFKEGKIYKEIFDSVLQAKISNPQMDRVQEINYIKEKFL